MKPVQKLSKSQIAIRTVQPTCETLRSFMWEFRKEGALIEPYIEGFSSSGTPGQQSLQ